MKKPLFIIRLNWVDVFTLTGVFTSSYAFILTFQGKFSFALAMLFIAMISDAMDGFLARHFKLERPFGRYLDGFIDVLIYLVGPALFMWYWGMNTWYYGIVIGLFMSSGIVRLSVFNEIGNIKQEETPGDNAPKRLAYLGMPVFWSLFILGLFYIISWFMPKTSLVWLFPFAALGFLVFTFFMVYNAPFFKFKSWKVLLLICILCALIFGVKGILEVNGVW